MSVYKKIDGTKNSNKEEMEPIEKQTTLVTLKNENINLSDELKKINSVISKLKNQITKNEQEKNILLTTNKKKETQLQDIKKQLEAANLQLNQLKEKNNLQSNENNDINSLQSLNENLKKEKENNNELILDLQNKITDLELKLKTSEKNMFLSLTKGKNTSLEIKSSKKNTLNNSNNNINNNNGTEMVNEILENNLKLKENLKKLQNDFNKIEVEKKQLITQLNKYNSDKEKIMLLLKDKEKKINDKMNKQKVLNDDILKQSLENQKIKNSLEIIQTNCQKLENKKLELEEIILCQEKKVNDLSKSVDEVMKKYKIRENKVNNDKIYILNLKTIIKDLEKEYNSYKLKKQSDYSQKLLNLQLQLDYLKNDNPKKTLKNRLPSGFNKNNNKLTLLEKINLIENSSNFAKSPQKYLENPKNNRYLKIPTKNRGSNKSALHKKNKLYNNNISSPNVQNKSKILNKKKSHKSSAMMNLKDKIIKNKINKNKFDNSINSISKRNVDLDNINNVDKNEYLLNKNFDNNRYLNHFPIISQKHNEISKSEEYEKQKVSEFKNLLNQIMHDLEN